MTDPELEEVFISKNPPITDSTTLQEIRSFTKNDDSCLFSAFKFDRNMLDNKFFGKEVI